MLGKFTGSKTGASARSSRIATQAQLLSSPSPTISRSFKALVVSAIPSRRALAPGCGGPSGVMVWGGIYSKSSPPDAPRPQIQFLPGFALGNLPFFGSRRFFLEQVFVEKQSRKNSTTMNIKKICTGKRIEIRLNNSSPTSDSNANIGNGHLMAINGH